jgi:hypothetical protein
VPFLLLFASAGIFATPAAWRSLEDSRRWVVVGAVAAVAIFANWPVLSPTLMMAITENNLGTALMEKKQYEQAIAHLFPA